MKMTDEDRKLTEQDLDMWADEILAAAKPKPVVKRREPPAPQGDGPRRPGAVAKSSQHQKPLTLAVQQKRIVYTADLSRTDYDAMAFSLRWASDQNERMQDRMFTISWSYAPADGMWYAWTWGHDAEAKTLAAAIDRLLEHYGVRR